MHAINICDILRLESNGTYTIICLKNKQQFVCSKHLKVILSELDPSKFFRVHKSHAINLLEIKNYEKGRGGYVHMSDESTVPVSQRKKAEFLNRLRNI